MMSAEQNDLMTKTGPAAPAGGVAAPLLATRGPVRGTAGRPADQGRSACLARTCRACSGTTRARLGLIDRDCPHRGADLAFGRIEDGGLRCLFHGWLFNTAGQCIETPAEPEGSTLCERVRQRSYPVCERNGIIFAYLGDGEPPAFPALDCFVAPDTHVFAFKGYLEL